MAANFNLDGAVAVIDLSPSPSAPCMILDFDNLSIMLDCGLDVSTMLNFLPTSPIQSSRKFQSSADAASMTPGIVECAGSYYLDSVPQVRPPRFSLEDLSRVEFILASNCYTILALPYIIETGAFRGTVLATEATAQFGIMLMRELAGYAEHTIPLSERPPSWKRFRVDNAEQSSSTSDAMPTAKKELMQLCIDQGDQWRRIYTPEMVERAVSRIHKLNFNENFDAFGRTLLTPTSSGYCIGSANWVMQTASERIVYMSTSSIWDAHPKEISYTKLYTADLLIANCLNLEPDADYTKTLDKICSFSIKTLKENRGNVLIPTYTTGIILDILEHLVYRMEHQAMQFTVIYLISPVGKASLAYANVFSEFLSNTRSKKVYLPEEPFVHADLQRQGKIVCASDISDVGEFRVPAIVLGGHPSLRVGPVVHLLNRWRSNKLNLLITIDPELEFQRAIGPYQPLQMHTIHCPLDVRLRPSDFKTLCCGSNSLQPRDIATPSVFVPELPSELQRSVVPAMSSLPKESSNNAMRIFSLEWQRGARFRVSRAYERITVSRRLLDSTFARTPNGAPVVAGSFRAFVQWNDNRAHLTTAREAVAAHADDIVSAGRRLLLSRPDSDTLKGKLRELGAGDIEQLDAAGDGAPSDGKVEINLPKRGTRIAISDSETVIHVDDIRSNRTFRQQVIEAISSSSVSV